MNVFDVDDIPVYKAFASCVPVTELTATQSTALGRSMPSSQIRQERTQYHQVI